jgi:hypothetical protein
VVDVHAPYRAGSRVDSERLVDRVPPKAQVDVAGQALVQKAMGEGSIERKKVEVREMGDPHGRSMRRMGLERQTSLCGTKRRSAATPDGIGTGLKVLEKTVRNATDEVAKGREAGRGRVRGHVGGRNGSRA